MLAAMLTCPHCSGAIDMRQAKHEGLFATHRACPSCRRFFDLDARTKTRQALMLATLAVALVLTVLTYFHGRFWAPFAVASYCLAGAVLYYGNKKMYLVEYTGGKNE